MGNELSTHEDTTISEDFRDRMHSSISDAHAISSRPNPLVLPWEQPSMRWILSDGADADPIVPDVPRVWDYVEPTPDMLGNGLSRVSQLSANQLSLKVPFHSIQSGHVIWTRRVNMQSCRRNGKL